MFTWFPLPDGEQNSDVFCRTLFEKAGVMCVPGSYFGIGGNNYVRFALTKPSEILREAAVRIGEFL
jgi:aspartate/methionine/tyrosine aminotransferase